MSSPKIVYSIEMDKKIKTKSHKLLEKSFKWIGNQTCKGWRTSS